MTEKDLKTNILCFIVLSTEAEKYGYAIKGNVTQEFKRKLNNYLISSKLLLAEINKFVDEETLESAGEVISETLRSQIKIEELNS